MLSELRIRNYALIEQLSLRLDAGLNVLTGETGAGKSIIVGALSLLLGERASADVVRVGADRASVEGVFDVHARPDLRAWLDEHGFDAADDTLVLKREVALEGRNRAWINGSPATAGLIGEVGRWLIAFHGQHENQALLRREDQRSILDAYGDAHDALAEVADAHAAWRAARREVETLDRRRRDAAQRADFLRFQVEELEAARLRPGEEEELEDDARRLSHAEELMSLSDAVYQAVSGADRALLGQLATLRRSLDQLARIDPAEEEARQLFDTAYYALEELGSRMERYAAGVEHDPDRLENIRRRQDLLYRLKSKYGPTLAEVLETERAARAELDLIDSAEWELGQLQKREREAFATLAEAAQRLRAVRQRAAASLARETAAILPDLGMAGGRFAVELLPLAEPAAQGAEEVEFRVALNKGFALKPIAQVASGGELSRVMLALKTILARLDAVPTLVFDEVDAGIGGRVALQVGEKMRQVAHDHQVFAITHLPQIASRAHVHLLVEKTEGDGATATHVRLLSAEQRTEELARMLGGDPDSAVSREHARELLGRSGA